MRYLVKTLAIMAIVAPATAHAASYSKEVRKSCAGDYQNFCSQYAPDTPQLRSCFESNRKGLSKFCINALIDAGEVPAKYLKK